MANNLGAAPDYTNMPVPNTSVLDTIRGVFGIQPGGANSPTGPLPFRPGVGFVDRARGAIGVPTGGFDGVAPSAPPISTVPPVAAANTLPANGAGAIPFSAPPAAAPAAVPSDGYTKIAAGSPNPVLPGEAALGARNLTAGLGAVPGTQVTYDAAGKRTVTINGDAQSGTAAAPASTTPVATTAAAPPAYQGAIDYGYAKQQVAGDALLKHIQDFVDNGGSPDNRSYRTAHAFGALTSAYGANNAAALAEQGVTGLGTATISAQAQRDIAAQRVGLERQVFQETPRVVGQTPLVASGSEIPIATNTYATPVDPGTGKPYAAFAPVGNGFGASTGTPTKAQALADAQATLKAHPELRAQVNARLSGWGYGTIP